MQNFFYPSIIGFTARSFPRLHRTCSSHIVKVDAPQKIYHIELNNQKRRNALRMQDYLSLRDHMSNLEENSNYRCAILSAKGNIFTSGMDLASFASLLEKLSTVNDVSRKALILNPTIKSLQDSLKAINLVNKPVIIAVNGPCIGAGTDMACMTDIRLCTSDSYFQVKEIQLGIPADLGSVQLLGRLINNDSLVRELVFTGRKFYADEALRIGFVSKVFDDKASLMEYAMNLARKIADQSPIAIRACKQSLNFSREHNLDESLEHVRLINQQVLQGEDFSTAVKSIIAKTKPIFND